MTNTIKFEELQKLINKYVEKGGICYSIEGCLLDNYILVGENLKTIIIKEIYLNPWSSTSTIRTYNRTPKKYGKIINLLEQNEEEKARELFSI